MSSDRSDLINFEFNPNDYDSSNPLVLPNKKTHKTKRQNITSQNEQSTILSKKKRKELERKVSQKNKKLSRADLWNELASFPESSQCSGSVLPIFNRCKTVQKPKSANDNHNVKGKSWGINLESLVDSTDTDDYSSSEEPEYEPGVIVPTPVISTVTEVKSKQEPVCESPEITAIEQSRTPEIEAERLSLPIISEESSIMDAISKNDCVIICGATGCGKTTQIPQFLYEGGYTHDGFMIGVTEPRRVAAISMSKRVAEELNCSSSMVSYHIRYEKTTHRETMIKFMTDGVLLQELKKDFELSRYSVIVIDEAHERSIFTDILIGLVSMIIRLRRMRFTDSKPTNGVVLPPLKLIIMSATLRVTDFSENQRLFPTLSVKPPPVIHVESRQYPVTCHFAKITQSDYLKAAFRKVVNIHQTAAPGGILVFLTGQREVLTLCSWLSRAFPVDKQSPVGAKSKKDKRQQCKTSSDPSPSSDDQFEANRVNLDNFSIVPNDEEAELAPSRRRITSDKKQSSQPDSTDAAAAAVDEEEDDCDLDELMDDDDALNRIASLSSQQNGAPVTALPLYSLLAPEKQQLVFNPPPDGHRLVVVATNVAETSLTIQNIRYVVDSGKIGWVSQASAEQRAGRAGRVASGHCYRLYSSSLFSSLAQFASPDILLRPMDDVVLMLKSYLGSISLKRFPLPTSPSLDSIEAAERRLVALGALVDQRSSSSIDGPPLRTISRAGQWMSQLPLPPRFSRMLLYSSQHNLMPYAVILVSALSVPDLFLVNTPSAGTESAPGKIPPQDDVQQFRANFLQQFTRRREDLLFGDLSVMLGAICCLERYSAQLSGLVPGLDDQIVDFCGGHRRVQSDPEGALRLLVDRCGLRWNAYKEVRQLRRQLTDILNVNIDGLDLALDPCLARPTASQVNQLRQLFLVGSPCHVAGKFDLPTGDLVLPDKDQRRLRYAYSIPGIRGPVFIHPDSPLARENCSFVAFLELHESTKPYLRGVCSIDPQWIPFFAQHCYITSGLTLTNEESTAKTTTDSSVTDSSSNVTSVPCYSSQFDAIVTRAKSVHYIGASLSSADNLDGGMTSYLELPTRSLLVPIFNPSSLAQSTSGGGEDTFLWSIRWFARLLLQGSLIGLKLTSDGWLPDRLKKTLSPQLLTVSWGIVRPEVRDLVRTLAASKVNSKATLEAACLRDPQFLLQQLSNWIRPESIADFHIAWPSLIVDRRPDSN